MCEKFPDVISMLNSIILDRNEELAQAVALLKKAEVACYPYCFSCGNRKSVGHQDACALAKFLRENQ